MSLLLLQVARLVQLAQLTLARRYPMNANQKIHQAKLSKWMAYLQDQSQSGLTVKAWCLENNVSIHAFYYWKRLAKESLVDSISPEIVPLSLSTPALTEENENAPASHTHSRELYNLCNQVPSKSTPITITSGDIRIDIASSADHSLVCDIIKAVCHA